MRPFYFFKEKDCFLQTAVTLTAGSVIAQLLPMLASPFLTRLYSPGELGTYGLFTAAFGVSSQIACLKYDLALAVSKEERGGLLRACLWTAAVVSLFLFPLGWFAQPLARFFQADSSGWIWWIAPATLGAGIHAALTGAALQRRDTQSICRANVARAVVLAVSQPLFYFWGASGLCAGHCFSYIAAWIPLVPGAREMLRQQKAGARQVMAVMAQNRGFPLYTLPGAFLGSLSYSVMGYGFSHLFSAQALGNYTLAVRVLSAPIGVFSAPVGQAYLSRAGEDGLLLRTTKLLLPIGIAGYGILLLGAGPILSLVFGPGWEQAAWFVQLLVPLYLVRFVTVPTSTAAIARGGQKSTALWQAGMLFLSVLPLVFSSGNADGAVVWHSVLMSLGYLLFYAYCWHLEKSGAGGR